MSFNEYRLLLEGKDAERRERYELARWLAYRIYMMNPYIKPPRAGSEKAFHCFGWEEITEEEAAAAAMDCRVTEAEANELDRIFAEIEKSRATQQ